MRRQARWKASGLPLDRPCGRGHVAGEILLEKGAMRLLAGKNVQMTGVARHCAPIPAVRRLPIISITTVMAPTGAMTATT